MCENKKFHPKTKKHIYREYVLLTHWPIFSLVRWGLPRFRVKVQFVHAAIYGHRVRPPHTLSPLQKKLFPLRGLRHTGKEVAVDSLTPANVVEQCSSFSFLLLPNQRLFPKQRSEESPVNFFRRDFFRAHYHLKKTPPFKVRGPLGLEDCHL